MIIPKLEDDEPLDEIKLNKFEAFMLEVLMTDEFDPSPPEHILAAFKVLDPEGKGYIEREILKEMIMDKHMAIAFWDKEYKDFEDFALDKTGSWFYYEDYVARLAAENEHHHENLIKDYPNFKPPINNQ